MTQKRSCPYKLRFGTYPRGPPFLGLIGAIIRSWNLRSGPFSRASNYPWAQCARWLISSVVAPATWLARFVFSFLRSLLRAVSLSPSLAIRWRPFSSLLGPRAAALYKAGPECFYSRGLAQPFHLIYSKPLFALPLVPASNSFLPSRKNDLTKLESAP